MCESRCQDHIDENIKLDGTLREIKDICNRYNEKGWALNPDKIIQIIEKALED